MSTVVHIRKSDNLDVDTKKSIHYVPCKIHLDGTANISQYFLPSSAKNGTNYVARNEARKLLSALKKKLSVLRETVVLVSIPHRHDLPSWSSVNADFKNTNETMNIICEHEASFRGHPLKGKVVEVPKDYIGLVLEERIQRSDAQDRTLHVTKTFNEITYWNWDKMPSQNDVFLAAMDWIDIANALHSPVDNV